VAERGGARDSGGRLRFFKIFPILSKKTPTISVTYKNSHKKAFGVLLKQKETPKKRTLKRRKKKESCTDGEWRLKRGTKKTVALIPC
jgi:hypothetical protein